MINYRLKFKGYMINNISCLQTENIIKSFLTAMYMIQIEAYMPSKHHAQIVNRVVYDKTLNKFLSVVHATRQYNKNFDVNVDKGRS